MSSLSRDRNVTDVPELVWAARLVAKVEDNYGLPRGTLSSRSRQQSIVTCRQACMTVIRDRTGLSLPVIGRLFGRDHTTILYGVHKTREFAVRWPESVEVSTYLEVDAIAAALEH